MNSDGDGYGFTFMVGVIVGILIMIFLLKTNFQGDIYFTKLKKPLKLVKKFVKIMKV